MSRCTVANFRRARRREAGWWRAARPAKKKPRIGGGALKFWESPNNDNGSVSTWCGHSMAVADARTQALARFQSQGADGMMLPQAVSCSSRGASSSIGALRRSPGTPHPGLFLRTLLAPRATRNGRTKIILGGLRDGRPRPLCGNNAVGDQSLPRGHPQVATSGCSVKYEGVVGKLCGRQCPGVHHYVVRINPLT